MNHLRSEVPSKKPLKTTRTAIMKIKKMVTFEKKSALLSFMHRFHLLLRIKGDRIFMYDRPRDTAKNSASSSPTPCGDNLSRIDIKLSKSFSRTKVRNREIRNPLIIIAPTGIMYKLNKVIFGWRFSKFWNLLANK